MSISNIISLSLIELFGDYHLKNFSNKGGIISLCYGIIGYIGVILALVVSFQRNTILMVNGLWDGISCIITSIFAYIFLEERFQYNIQYIGIILIIIGLFCLKIPLYKQHNFIIPFLF